MVVERQPTSVARQIVFAQAARRRTMLTIAPDCWPYGDQDSGATFRFGESVKQRVSLRRTAPRRAFA